MGKKKDKKKKERAVMQPYEYFATLTNIVDGDTLDFLVDLGFGVSIALRTRLLGVDTPEVHGVSHDSPEHAQGAVASVFVTTWFSEREGKPITVRTHQDKKGKYGRYLAEVSVEGESLNQVLRDQGWADEVS